MEAIPGTEDEAVVRLTPDEAVVLFDLLSRWTDSGGVGETPSSRCFQSTAEGAVLNTVCTSLERQVSSVFRSDYLSIVTAARDRLASEWSHPTLRG
jgi:hypothetical protein